jgi:carboxylesterase type B
MIESTGATHFQEVAFVLMNYNGDGYATNPFSGPETYQQKAKNLLKIMDTAWVNFIVAQDPNGRGGSLSADFKWPAYDTSVSDGVGAEVVWSLDDTHVGLDDYRKQGMEWMMDHMLSVFGM